jgi:hypothetical protein
MRRHDRDDGPSRAQEHEVRAHLLTWDPIGVDGLPEAADEYDCLIDPIVHRLRDGVSAEALASWLCEELEDHFGLEPDTGRERALAIELTAWWRSSTQRL